ncbi:MAG: phage-shock protein [Desulforhopalus sp.]
MLNIVIVAIVFGSIIALATLICGTVLLIVKTRSSSNGHGATDSDEARLIQEIYQSLEKMEKRIESLETILMDGQKKDGYKQ